MRTSPTHALCVNRITLFMTNKTQRLYSIDAFRAITMLLMIFVNDVSSVSRIPSWIGHVSADTDGMGFADTVFPSFLFIVGLSLPHAIGYRLKKQQSFLSIASHIFLRSLALIVMGFFHVNLESYNDAAVLPYPVWELVITVAFFLIWLDYPDTLSRKLRYSLIGVGIAALVAMAWLYKGGEPGHPHWMEQSWGGILGIIGWAYLVSALVFLLVRGQFGWLLGATSLFLAINIGTHGGWWHVQLPVIGDASAIVLVMGGAVISVCYSRLLAQQRLVWPVLTIAGVIAIVLGFIVRPYTGGISKIGATPAWVLICGGISILVFELLIYVVDVCGKTRWYRLIRPGGTATLTCYLMPYLFYSLMMLAGISLPAWFNTGIGGILRSFAVALLLIMLAGWMEKKHLKLKI